MFQAEDLRGASQFPTKYRPSIATCKYPDRSYFNVKSPSRSARHAARKSRKGPRKGWHYVLSTLNTFAGYSGSTLPGTQFMPIATFKFSRALEHITRQSSRRSKKYYILRCFFFRFVSRTFLFSIYFAPSNFLYNLSGTSCTAPILQHLTSRFQCCQ